MKTEVGFFTQYQACKEDGMLGKGRYEKFKDFPENLPAVWHPAAPKFAKALKKNPELGLETIACLRFGGDCRSDNPACRIMRGLELKGQTHEQFVLECDSRVR